MGKKIGIIGAGSFGRALGQVLKKNGNHVLFYVRTPRDLPNSTTALKILFSECQLIFIIIPVENIISLVSQIKQFVTPQHAFIHCIKGLVLTDETKICRKNTLTVSEFLKIELNTTNLACLSGPNLANEIKMHQLTSAVIASKIPKIRTQIKQYMSNNKFIISESEDIIGVEICGILKNIIALASGILNGLGEGDNGKALLMTLGLNEMKNIIKIFTDVNFETLYSVAGIGDLIATCSSNLSRNFTTGNRIAHGEKLDNILAEGITAEGVKTTFIINTLAEEKNIHLPITQTIFKILFSHTNPKLLLEALHNILC